MYLGNTRSGTGWGFFLADLHLAKLAYNSLMDQGKSKWRIQNKLKLGIYWWSLRGARITASIYHVRKPMLLF